MMSCNSNWFIYCCYAPVLHCFVFFFVVISLISSSQVKCEPVGLVTEDHDVSLCQQIERQPQCMPIISFVTIVCFQISIIPKILFQWDYWTEKVSFTLYQCLNFTRLMYIVLFTIMWVHVQIPPYHLHRSHTCITEYHWGYCEVKYLWRYAAANGTTALCGSSCRSSSRYSNLNGPWHLFLFEVATAVLCYWRPT